MTGQLDTPAPCFYCQQPTWRAVAWHRGVAPPPRQSSGKSSVATGPPRTGARRGPLGRAGHLLGQNDDKPGGLVTVADKSRHLSHASALRLTTSAPGAQDAASLASYCATMGDGVLATFDGPARAIRCARAIRDGVRGLGIEVRAGVHTGEVESRGDDVGGSPSTLGYECQVWRDQARCSCRERSWTSWWARNLVRGPRPARTQGSSRRLAPFRRRR